MLQKLKIAVFSRPGPCFPNVISQGLVDMLRDLQIESKIFYDSIPMLMRLLPLNKKPKRWYNNLQFRIRNKLVHYREDKKLIKELKKYDAIIISECYPNAFWRNYFAIEELKALFHGPVISYTESPLNAAPLNKERLLDKDDYGEDIYDFNLFVTDVMETKISPNEKQAIAGNNLSHNTSLTITAKKEFTAVVDFAQPGYERYREQQLHTLVKMGIKTIVLEGRYPIEEIRNIYAQASVFFISFPETFGLPIAECLACGAYVFTPDSAWPMAWRLDEHPVSMAPGILPSCFRVYSNEADLENQLREIMNTYDPKNTPAVVFNTFLAHYRKFYYGDREALQSLLNKFN